MPKRVTAFVDGFNLYHAIDDCKKHHWKWVDLRRLCREFAPRPDFDLTDVLYFSAYAEWRRGGVKRHREYVKALQACGVKPLLANFKLKDRSCPACGHSWKGHEEKETDVHLASVLVCEAFKDSYDRALIVSQDSDLTPAVKLVMNEFPGKDVRVITPIGRNHSSQLAAAVGGFESCRNIKPVHLDRCLLPAQVGEAGNVIATRPKKYDPTEPTDK